MCTVSHSRYCGAVSAPVGCIVLELCVLTPFSLVFFAAAGYERTWPLAAGGKVTQQNYDQPGGPVYIINGQSLTQAAEVSTCVWRRSMN